MLKWTACALLVSLSAPLAFAQAEPEVPAAEAPATEAPAAETPPAEAPADAPADEAPAVDAPAAAEAAAPGAPAPEAAAPAQPVAESRIVSVTVYQGTALVTREVTVPAGRNLVEVVVSPLPPRTVDSSLYTEGTDGIRVLSTRYRTRAVQEDTREEVRALEQRVRDLQQSNESLQQDLTVFKQNVEFLTKLETFTAATMAQLTDKGALNGEATIALSKYVMETRERVAGQEVKARQQSQENEQQVAFAQRQLAELTAGASRTLRDAVITVDKGDDDDAGTVRLNYLVDAASWSPQYKLRAGKDKEPVQLEYLAAIVQQSGEDWPDASVTLSTAEPMLNAAPPVLLALDIDVTEVRPPASGQPQQQQAMQQMQVQKQQIERVKGNRARAQELRKEAQRQLNENKSDDGFFASNSAAALEQTNELLDMGDAGAGMKDAAFREGPSVTYRLANRLTVPSRTDQQLIEVARIELAPDYFYKAVPVLTQHVYRLARLTNTSEHVLLPGEATMYQGSDFVGRMNLPLVVIGEEFTAGFGVDPQLQVARELVNKSRTVQGGNQVHTYEYRIRVSSFKPGPANVQVWDRLPKADAEAVGVSLVKAAPELSTEAGYVRAERPQNLLRWDVLVEPGENGEKAATVGYEFKLEYDRNVAIGNFKATW
jgi:hypothetical protein